MSKVYRFHCQTTLHNVSDLVRLYKRKKNAGEEVQLIAADTSFVTDDDGTRPIESFKITTSRIRFITLTRFESDLIALSNPGVKPPSALEELHPWLPDIRYLNDSNSNFKALKRIVRKYGHHFVLNASYCDEKWNAICNALRKKSILDARFYTAWHLPIQEVYLLEENRSDRSVVSIDFNAMYSACMQQLFPKPSDLRLVRFDRYLDESEILQVGLYKCILSGPKTDFIIRHNPFRSFHLGRHLCSQIDEAIEVDLNEFEVEFYRRHFQSIKIIDAVIASKVVVHPLAKDACRSFSKRRNYCNQGNKALADREKFLSTLMSSCANRPFRPIHHFDTRDSAMNELRNVYGISLPDDEPEIATDIWLQGRKGVKLIVRGRSATIQGPNLHDGSACYLLGQRIVAKSRIVLLEMMERILCSAPDVDICYINIDSIHFSFPTQHLKSMLTWLESQCSDSMGSFKIEAVTQHGLWLEPGRYWLYSDKVDKFRNRSVGDQQQPFKDHSVHVVSRKLNKLYVPIKATLRMESTMSPLRSLIKECDCSIFRQRLIEVGDVTQVEEILSELERNHRDAIPLRIDAFKSLKKRLGFPRVAATKRRK
ncbi:hypothetical protein OQ486_16270 [Plesiomonas shigelloides]|uniref:hypothetical protein n=1 Tax=Plesiomonas shigelloides TaxID=703 RepID=UPI002245C497|nr:hypothetical protein [Plesiomonas shigelloides]MCX2535001.1 hypothetical protein [Plesiomonas shigelloides]